MTEETKNPDDVTLNVQDLTNIKTIIEIAQSRGAFEAQELTTVGQTFDKLTNFLNVVVAAAQVKADENNTNEEETVGDQKDD
jgi:hypothetical protein